MRGTAATRDLSFMNHARVGTLFTAGDAVELVDAVGCELRARGANLSPEPY